VASITERIKLLKGDLTDFEGDAVVNAANTDLILGGGVAGAIRRKGGPSIQEECNKIGKIKLGEAILTKGGNLKARYVIHAAAMGLDEPCTEESLRMSVYNSLLRSYEMKLKSIAMPAIGMGIASFPLKEGSKIMLETILNFVSKNDYPEIIYIYLYDDVTFDVFKKTLEKLKEAII
jgi:O-acetyl-ADP-ribose deacetylase (regulator of RNase III)